MNRADHSQSMRKNKINLYTDALRPPRELLTLKTVLWLVVLIILIAIAWRGQIAWQSQRLEQQQAQLQTQFSEVQSRIAELAQRQRQRQIDTSLEAEVTRLEREIQGLQTLSSAVLRSGSIEDENHARLLRDLSAIHQPGLWLSHIENQQGRLILRGQTEHSGHLPQWMARFSNVPSLQGKQFAVVALERDGANLLRFEVRSQREQSGQEAAQ